MRKKVKRNHRLVYIAQYLVNHPNQLVNLSVFTEYFDAAKSSISEDIQFVREIFIENQLGLVQTVPGIKGGVIYYPEVPTGSIEECFGAIESMVLEGNRILPGNYINLNDVIHDPYILTQVAKLIASYYGQHDVDVIMTIETKGIGLATMVAHYMNIPFVIVRRDSTDMVGPTISVNYISGSHQIVKKMELDKNSLASGSKVLIVDDFLRNGGTVNGLLSLLNEFDCKSVGICVFAESVPKDNQALPDYQSVVDLQIKYYNEEKRFKLAVKPGTLLKENI